MLLSLTEAYLFALELPLSVGQVLIFVHELFVVFGSGYHLLLDSYMKKEQVS